MSDGGGFAVGIGAGMASGMAIGLAGGRKKAREDILKYSASRAITVRDQSGEELPMEQFLDEALPTEKKSRAGIIVLLAGLVIVLGIAVFIFLSRGG
jgi:hypothetical protein